MAPAESDRGGQHRGHCPRFHLRTAAGTPRPPGHRPCHPRCGRADKARHRILPGVPVAFQAVCLRAGLQAGGGDAGGCAAGYPRRKRLRAGGAGVPAFFTPTGAGTVVAEGKETRIIDGREYVLEQAIRGDFAFIRANKADTAGNLVYRGTSRNFNAAMATAAQVTIAEVDEIVEAGSLDPDEIVTPGLYVDRIVQRPARILPLQANGGGLA